MKRTLSALLAVLFVFACCLSATAFDLPEKLPTGKTTAKVQLYKTAGSGSLGSVASGKTVTIIGKSGNYYRVIYGNYAGYIKTKYVQFSGTDASMGDYGEVTGSTKLYKKNSTKNGSLCSLKAGESLLVVGESGSYYLAVYGNSAGYVPKKYVEEEYDTIDEGYEDGGYAEGGYADSALFKALLEDVIEDWTDLNGSYVKSFGYYDGDMNTVYLAVKLNYTIDDIQKMADESDEYRANVASIFAIDMKYSSKYQTLLSNSGFDVNVKIYELDSEGKPLCVTVNGSVDYSAITFKTTDPELTNRVNDIIDDFTTTYSSSNCYGYYDEDLGAIYLLIKFEYDFTYIRTSTVNSASTLASYNELVSDMEDLSAYYKNYMDEGGYDYVRVCIGFTDYSGDVFYMAVDGTTIRNHIS